MSKAILDSLNEADATFNAVAPATVDAIRDKDEEICRLRTELAAAMAFVRHVSVVCGHQGLDMMTVRSARQHFSAFVTSAETRESQLEAENADLQRSLANALATIEAGIFADVHEQPLVACTRCGESCRATCSGLCDECFPV